MLNGAALELAAQKPRWSLLKITCKLWCTYKAWGTWEFLKNSFKRVRAFQIELEFGGVGFWVGRKTGLFPKKNLLEQEREPTKNSYELSHIASSLGSTLTLILELKCGPYSKSKKKNLEKFLFQPRKMLLVPVPNNLEVKAGASFALGFRSLICGKS